MIKHQDQGSWSSIRIKHQDQASGSSRPHLDGIQTASKPHSDHIQATSRPHPDRIQTASRLHLDCILTTSRPHPDRIHIPSRPDQFSQNNATAWALQARRLMFAWHSALDYPLFWNPFYLSSVLNSFVFCVVSTVLRVRCYLHLRWHYVLFHPCRKA